MKLFGIKIDLKKVAAVATPVIISAVVLKQPVKKVIGQIVRDELDKAGGLTPLACRVAAGTVTLFADARMVLSLVVLSAGSGAWALAARSELAATLFLSILALALTAAILYVGEQREERASRRDEAMHRKLDGLVHGVPDADDALAGIER